MFSLSEHRDLQDTTIQTLQTRYVRQPTQAAVMRKVGGHIYRDCSMSKDAAGQEGCFTDSRASQQCKVTRHAVCLHLTIAAQ